MMVDAPFQPRSSPELVVGPPRRCGRPDTSFGSTDTLPVISVRFVRTPHLEADAKYLAAVLGGRSDATWRGPMNPAATNFDESTS